MKKTIMAIIALLPLLLLVSSCNSEPPYLFGPAFSKPCASKYLKSQEVSPETIDKIITLDNMPQEDFEKYSRSDDIYVRHLIASNPHTPLCLLEVLAKDKDKFVRQGVALNTAIDDNLIGLLKNDPYYYIQCVLVTNPSVPENAILWIYENNKKVSLRYYASNPKCPKVIKDDIMCSDDKDAKYWLKYAEGSGK